MGMNELRLASPIYRRADICGPDSGGIGAPFLRATDAASTVRGVGASPRWGDMPREVGQPSVAGIELRGPAGRRLNSRVAAVPFTLKNLKEDLEDFGSNFDGAPDLEFRLATKALELEQSGLSYQRIPPDYRFPYGHTHKEQEEVYVVVRGSGRMKLDGEIVELKEWDVVRVPPGTWRGYEGGPEGLEILVFGAPNLGEDPREDVEGERGWWAD